MTPTATGAQPGAAANATCRGWDRLRRHFKKLQCAPQRDERKLLRALQLESERPANPSECVRNAILERPFIGVPIRVARQFTNEMVKHIAGRHRCLHENGTRHAATCR